MLAVCNGVASATQTSSFSATRLEGSGRASFNSNYQPGSVASIYDITFDVDTATPFSLTGVLENIAPGSLFVSLTGETEIFAFSAMPSYPYSYPFATSGVLDPGRYRLLVSGAYRGQLGASHQTFQFDLQAIPEPQSVLLLGAGLAMLASQSLRRSRRWT
jgi:hypothetical protein